ncbi:Na+/H+ antiporter [Exiguobacterium antarcticum]|uniref:Na+/H+ antiporter n=1 Tax=Exiguobacterium antarcticum TaxID=132920 RepID=UPI000285EDFB|nr:Na+/H+ antiporter [Exiguobacterium antarcticum]AFS70488.1 Sodium/hydrogen exchanger [Exiguobacterium antarcticum B7]
METLSLILLMLVLIILTQVLGHYIRFIPTALIQILVGTITALLISGLKIEVESEWFLLLFIAPLLYNDSSHFPRDELWKMRAAIFGNAIVLVLLTTVIGGYFINWLVPVIPVAAAFALAAILSPTDPIAVNGIAKRVQIPEQILNLVRGESLINDASGLVAFSYAVAAVVTGYFSIQQATTEFVYMFVVGAVVGLAISIAMNWLKVKLRRTGIEDVVFYVLLQILTPFIIFFVAEEVLHASGVIAVVTGGILHALIKERTETFFAQEQTLTDNIWTMIAYILNGIIFLLLGLTLPEATREIFADDAINNWRLMLFVIEIGGVILLIRLIWTMFFNWFDHRFLKKADHQKPAFKQDVITTLVGVRGTITMVGVLSLPFLTESGEAFPERSLIIFLAAGVIIFTLILATILLPLLNRGEADAQPELDLNAYKQRMVKRAITEIKQVVQEENSTVAFDLLNEYHVMLRLLRAQEKSEEELMRFNEQLKHLRLEAETSGTTKQFLQEHKTPEQLRKEVFRSIDNRIEAIEKEARFRLSQPLRKILWKRKRSNMSSEQLIRLTQVEHELYEQVMTEVITRLEGCRGDYPVDVVQSVLEFYKRLRFKHTRWSSPVGGKADVDQQKEELCLRAIEVQRQEIASMSKEGDLSGEEEKELRRFIHYIESVVLYEYVE